MADQYEINRVFTLSTAHAPSAEHLQTIQNANILPTWDTEYGVVMIIPPTIVHPDFGSNEDEKQLKNVLGGEVFNILKFAREQLNCWAVNFDCDGNKYERFQTFDW